METENNIIDISPLKQGFIRESPLNSVCYMVGKVIEELTDDVDLLDMGDTYLVANKKLNKSIELNKKDWEYTCTDNHKYVFGVKGTGDKWVGLNQNYGEPINCIIISGSDGLVDRIIHLDTFKNAGDLKENINTKRQFDKYTARLTTDDKYLKTQEIILMIFAVLILILFLIK